jgi:hypothetical protein
MSGRRRCATKERKAMTQHRKAHQQDTSLRTVNTIIAVLTGEVKPKRIAELTHIAEKA